ncbi:MAG: molybdopterin-dependent oxidoreductase [Thermoleophilia bacterium]|nr:molybdopterin-dependent oxidoreductase [Thermoleophilia bacterium]
MRTISRRDFLRLGAASTAVLAVESQFRPLARAAELLEGGRSVNRTSGLPRSFLPSTCTQCPAGCGIIGYVEESRLVKIGGNTKHISNAGTLCARGQAGINALYDPDRLLKPLKRTGARGQDSWVEIEWEEALAEVAQRMAAARSNPQSLLFLTEDVERDPLGRRFTHAYGSPNAIGSAGIHDANKKVATSLTWGAAGDIPDVARCKYVLVFGANPLENNPNFVGMARRFVDGIQQNQSKVVVFDVRLSHTTTFSHELHYVAPGKMALVALAMANVIMQDGLYDRDFIERWTNVSPEQLAQHLAQYSPERAEAEAGVSALDIRRLAAEFASTKPATTITDSVLSGFSNGVQNERAVMLLSIITGNIDNRGGLCMPRQYGLDEPAPAPPQPGVSVFTNPENVAFPSQQAVAQVLRQAKDRQAEVRVLMTHSVNPLYSSPDEGLNEDVLRDENVIPFHVAITPYLNETAAFADIIMPETTYMEDWEIEVRPSLEQVPFVALRQPVVPPLESARSFFEIARDLASRIGGGMEQFFAFNSVSDYLKARISSVGGLANAGGLDYLKQHGIWFDPKSRPNYGSYEAGGFSTPSGRIEVFSPRLAERGFAPLPSYETVQAFRELGERELVLTIYETALHTDGKTGNCMWLNEIQHDNPALINPETAARLGIEDGDKIKLIRSSKSGEAKERSIETEAFLTEGVHPDVIAMANGVGHTGFGRIAQGEKFKKDEVRHRELRDANFQLVWWGDHGGTGVNAKRIVPIEMDPIGGGQAWGDMVVSVAKD